MWGTPGSGHGQFIVPAGVAVDTSGNVFVVDSYNDRIQKFTSAGTFIRTWGTPGIGPGEFLSPTYLAVINTGTVVLKEYVYVVDLGNGRIHVYTWKPDVQSTTNLNPKGSLQNNSTAVTSK
jgi:tripartite motif-containing protein 71